MGLFNRISTIFAAKVNKIVDAAEDPRETLEYAEGKLLEQHKKVKQGVRDVTAARIKLEKQREKLAEAIANHDRQAREAVRLKRDDLARSALERKATAEAQVEVLGNEITRIEAEQKKLVEADKRLETKIQAFRSRKEVIKAQYTVAEANVKIGESISGISEEMADIGVTIERAESKTQDMQSRSAAIDELIETGTLTDITATQDDIDRELAKISAPESVETELARLKDEAKA